MTITSEQETYIIKMIAGFYHVAPGKQYLDEYGAMVEAGTSLEELAEHFAGSPAYIDGMLNGDTSTAAQVGLLMSHYGLTPDHSDPESVDRVAEDFFTAEFESGYSAGEIIVKVIKFMEGEVPEAFTPLQTLYYNKAYVSEAYSAAEYSINPHIFDGLNGDAPLTQEQIDDIVAEYGGYENGYTVVTGIEDIQYAQAMRDEFLKEAAQDPNTPGIEPPLTQDDIAQALTDSIAAVDALIAASGVAAAGDYIAATGDAAIQAALIKQAMGANDIDKANANSALTAATAAIAAVPGLSEAMAELAAATDAAATASLDVDIAFGEYGIQESVYNATALLPADETPKDPAAPILSIGDSSGTLAMNDGSGNLILETGVTEANHPGITDLMDAATAYNASVAAAEQATKDAATAQLAVDALDPTGDLTKALTEAEADVAAAYADMEALDTAVYKQEEAQADVDTLAALDAEIAAAFDAFVEAGLEEPIQLNDPTTAATSNDDIFFIGTDPSPDITSFGTVGNDQLVIGSNYVLNYDPVAGNNGDNYALEVWITEAGANTLVTVEESVLWGSSAKVPEVVEVQLVGVARDDVFAQDGIISV